MSSAWIGLSVLQSATVGVRAECPRQSHSIDPGLLLANRPRACPPRLFAMEVVDQLRPLNTTLNSHLCVLGIQLEHPVERSRVEVNGVFTKLLATHGVAAAGDADRQLLGRGITQDL